MPKEQIYFLYQSKLAKPQKLKQYMNKSSNFSFQIPKTHNSLITLISIKKDAIEAAKISLNDDKANFTISLPPLSEESLLEAYCPFWIEISFSM